MSALVEQMLRSAGLAAAPAAKKKPVAKKKPKKKVVKKPVKKVVKKPVAAKKAPAKTVNPAPAPTVTTATTSAAPVTPVVTQTAPAVVTPTVTPVPVDTSMLPAWPAVMPPASAGQGSAPGGVALSSDPVAHVARRLTFGATNALVAEIRSTGVAAWIDQQLRPANIDDSACDAAVAQKFPLLAMDSLTARQNMDDFSWDAMEQVTNATLFRAMVSRRQLFEAVVDVWSQHFNVTCPSDLVWSTRHVYDRTLRTYALGKFSDLLLAVETSPSMLQYLNNDISDGSSTEGVNENLGRELMELHTVGINAGYTETDVRNSAEAISGLSVMDDGSDLFEYKPGYRYVGAVQVLGWSSANADPYGGLAVAKDYFTYLAHHPQTALNVCTKLARRFVSDAPSSSLLQAMTAAYAAYDTAIVPVLRTMFAHGDFWASWGQKYKRPMEFVTSTVRSIGVTPTDDANSDAFADWGWDLGSQGMAPLGWAPPSGYPDVAAAWLSTMGTLGRWNASVAAVGAWFSGDTAGATFGGTDWSTLLGGVKPATFGAFVDALSTRLIGQTLSATDRSAILTYCGKAASAVPTSDDLQWRTGDIAMLVLSSSTWSLR